MLHEKKLRITRLLEVHKQFIRSIAQQTWSEELKLPLITIFLANALCSQSLLSWTKPITIISDYRSEIVDWNKTKGMGKIKQQ